MEDDGEFLKNEVHRVELKLDDVVTYVLWICNGSSVFSLPPAYVIRREGNSFTLLVCSQWGEVSQPGGGQPAGGWRSASRGVEVSQPGGISQPGGSASRGGSASQGGQPAGGAQPAEGVSASRGGSQDRTTE